MSDDDYDAIERLIDTDSIALGARCRKAEHDRDTARDLAFRAAFAPEGPEEDEPEDVWRLYRFDLPKRHPWPVCPANVLAQAERIMAGFDESYCPVCQQPIGAGLAGDADEFVTWRSFYVLIDRRGVPWPCCEDCASPLPLPEKEVSP